MVLSVLMMGCGGTNVGGGVDAGGGDAGVGGPDAVEPPSTILEVSFKAIPGVPGDVGGPFKVKLATAQLLLWEVRAIGDVSPGDTTHRDSLLLSWSEGELEMLAFRGAPPGLYSNLRAQVVSYQLTGTVELTDGVETGFTVSDAPSPSLSIWMPFSDGRLEAGETKTVEVKVDLGDVLRDLPWDLLDQGDDPIVIDEASSSIGDVRDELTEAFGLDL